MMETTEVGDEAVVEIEAAVEVEAEVEATMIEAVVEATMISHLEVEAAVEAEEAIQTITMTVMVTMSLKDLLNLCMKNHQHLQINHLSSPTIAKLSAYPVSKDNMPKEL